MKKGWEMKRLGDICEIIMGQSPTSDTYNEFEGMPFFQGNADFGELFPRKRIYCTKPIKIARNEDILISVRAPIGALNFSDCDCCIGRGLAALRPKKDKSFGKFLYYLLLQNRKNLIDSGTGSTFKSIGKDLLNNLSTRIPNITIQKKIVQELDTLNATITKKKQQLEELDKLAQATFYEMFGDLKRNDKSWTFYFLKDVCSDIVDCPHSTPTKAQTPTIYPCIRTSELKKGQIVWKSMQYVTESEYNKRVARLKPRKGDIVYGREGSYGDAVCLPGGFNFCLGQRTMLFRPNSKIIDIFLLYALLTDFVYNQAKIKNSGSTVGHVNVTDVKMFKIPLPPIEIQQKFVEYMNSIESQKSLIQQSLTDTQQLFDYTMNKYFGS